MPKILAVDDSPSMREMVAFTLKGGGHEVFSAVDGADAFEVAQTTKVDLVLTDVNMPNVDGIELVKKLRGLENYKFTPILLRACPDPC